MSVNRTEEANSAVGVEMQRVFSERGHKSQGYRDMNTAYLAESGYLTWIIHDSGLVPIRKDGPMRFVIAARG